MPWVLSRASLVETKHEVPCGFQAFNAAPFLPLSKLTA